MQVPSALGLSEHMSLPAGLNQGQVVVLGHLNQICDLQQHLVD